MFRISILLITINVKYVKFVESDTGWINDSIFTRAVYTFNETV